MDTSIVKLSLLDANGKQRNTTWKTECYVKCLADAAVEGCRRLGFDNTVDLVMLDQTDAANEEEKLPDDVVEPKKMYLILDRRILDNRSTSSKPAIPSTTSATTTPHRFQRVPSATFSATVTDSTALDNFFIDKQSQPLFDDLQQQPPRQSSARVALEPSSSNIKSSPRAPRTHSGSPSRLMRRFSSFTLDGSASTTFDGTKHSSSTTFAGTKPSSSTAFTGPQASSSTTFTGPQASSSTTFTGPQASSSTRPRVYSHSQLSRRMQLEQFFEKKEESVNTAYATFAHVKPLLFFNTDLFDYFNENFIAKCAVVLLRSETDPRLINAAHHILCQALKELIKELRPKFDIAHGELQVLPSLVNKLASTQLFLNLTLDNHQGVIDRYVLRERQKLASKSPIPKLKSKHLVNHAQNLDEISSRIHLHDDDSTLHPLFESTSATRSAWLRQLWVDPAFKRGMVTYFLSKFPQIKSDLSLIRYDFVNLTTNKRKHPADLAVKFRGAVPQIYECASKYGLPVPVYHGLHDKEFQAGDVLSKLIVHHMHVRQFSYDRLLVKCTDTTDYHQGLRQKNEMGITAPAIVALGTYPDTTFFIAVDDVALKVNGHFADALQSFMEVVYVFNLTYDPETVAIVYLFQVLMGFTAKSSPRRQTLINMLYPVATPTMGDTLQQEEPSNGEDDDLYSNAPSTSQRTRQLSRKRRQPSTISTPRQSLE